MNEMTKFIVKHVIIKMKSINGGGINTYYSVKSTQCKVSPFIRYGSVSQVKNFNANQYTYEKVLSILKEIDTNAEIYEQKSHHTNKTYKLITDNIEPIWEH